MAADRDDDRTARGQWLICHRNVRRSGATRRNAMATSLPVTRLGRTDMLLTRAGLGAWAIGGGGWAFAWGSQDDSESIAAIRHAVESGVNWIDTAAVHGLGHSEEIVAAALAGLPEADRPYVFTKAGLVWDPA